MNTRWLVTPFFIDEPDAALTEAVPPGIFHRLNDPGPIPDRSPASLIRTHQPIADFVSECASTGILPVSVAGDCVASLPVVAGIQRAGLDPALVWLDAHGDFNTAETSPSGFLGGMPLAMMVGRGDLPIPRQLGHAPVPENRVWLVGARNLDKLEAEALDASRVNRIGLDAMADLVIDRPVCLHIDNDIIDPSDAPANNYPVPGGPGLQRTIEACTAFAARNRLCAISLSGWNGSLDPDGRTASACAAVLSSIITIG